MAINKFVILLDEDLLNTRNKPKELPSSAMMKITAYAEVIPIFTSVRMKEFEKVDFEPSVTLVPFVLFVTLAGAGIEDPVRFKLQITLFFAVELINFNHAN